MTIGSFQDNAFIYNPVDSHGFFFMASKKQVLTLTKPVTISELSTGKASYFLTDRCRTVGREDTDLPELCNSEYSATLKATF